MNKNKMETMPVNKLLITIAAPMVLSMLIGALYNVVDSLFVSHYGEKALSAVSLAFPIQNIIIATGTGIGVGINALLSSFLGEKKQKKVNQTALHGIILGIRMCTLIFWMMTEGKMQSFLKKHFMRKRIWIHRCGRCSIRWRKR